MGAWRLPVAVPATLHDPPSMVPRGRASIPCHVEVAGKGELVGRDTKRTHVVRLADVVAGRKAHGEKTTAVEHERERWKQD